MDGFTLTTDKVDGIFIVRTSGYIDQKAGTQILDSVRKAVANGILTVIVNFTASPVINSAGIGQIFEMTELLAMEKCGKMAFAGLSKVSQGVFKVIGLLKYSQTFATEKEALETLSLPPNS